MKYISFSQTFRGEKITNELNQISRKAEAFG